MQHGKLYKLQRTIVGRLDEKKRIYFSQKKHSFRHVENCSLRVLFIFPTKKCNYKITGRVEIVELFTLHLLVYFAFPIQRIKQS